MVPRSNRRTPEPIKMRHTKFKIYLFSELILYLALLFFQIIYISKGYLLVDRTKDLFVAIAALHVAITFVSFFFALFIFMSHGEKIREDLFLVYFSLILSADVFFSFTDHLFVGHILFALAYVIFMVIRKAKPLEYLIACLIGIAALTVICITKKITLILGIDCFLASALLINLIGCISNYVKERSREKRLFMIALISICISDLSIALSTLFKSGISVNAMCLITWPTYFFGCVLLALAYSVRSSKKGGA